MRQIRLLLFAQFIVYALIAQQRQIVLPIGHNKTITCADFSPENKFLATGSADHTVKIWEVKSGILLRSLHKHKGKIEHVAFSEDGSSLFSYSATDTLGVFWNLLSGEIIGKCNTRYYEVSPDHRYVAIRKNDDASIVLYKLSSGQMLSSQKIPLGYPCEFHFSSDSRILTANYRFDYDADNRDEYTKENSIRALFFNVSPFTKTKEFVCDISLTEKIEMLRNNELFAVGQGYNTGKVLSTNSENGISLYSAFDGNFITNVPTNGLTDQIKEDTIDGVLIGLNSGAIRVIYNYRKSKLIYAAPGDYSSEIMLLGNTMKFFAQVYEYGSNKETEVKSISDLHKVSEPECFYKTEYSKSCRYKNLSFSKDDKYIVPFNDNYCNNCNHYHFISTASGKETYSFVPPDTTASFSRVQFSNSGDYFLLYSHYADHGEGMIGKIGVPGSNKMLPTAKQNEQHISFTDNDSAFILKNGDDAFAWNVTTGKLIGTSDAWPAKQVYMSPSGKAVITKQTVKPKSEYGNSKIILSCINPGGDILFWSDTIIRYGFYALDVVFSPQGDKFCLSGYLANKAYIYNVENGNKQQLELPVSLRTTPVFSPDGTKLVVHGSAYDLPKKSKAGTEYPAYTINLNNQERIEYKRQDNAAYCANSFYYTPSGKFIYSRNKGYSRFPYWSVDNPDSEQILQASNVLFSNSDNYWLFDSAASTMDDCWLLKDKEGIKFSVTTPESFLRCLSPDGTTFIVTNYRNRAAMWNVKTCAQYLSLYYPNRSTLLSVPFLSSRGEYIAIADWNKLSVFDKSNKAPIIESPVDNADNTFCRFSPDNTYMAVNARDNGEIDIYNLNTGKLKGIIKSEDGSYFPNFSISNTRNLLVAQKRYSTDIEVYTLKDITKPLIVLKNAQSDKYSNEITFSFDSLDEVLTVINIDEDNLKQFKLSNGELLSSVTFQVSRIRNISQSPSKKWIGIFSKDSLTICTGKGEINYQIPLQDVHYHYQLFWVMDGAYFLLLHEKADAVLYKTADFKRVMNYENLLGIPEEIFVLPDGKDMIYCNQKRENLLVDIFSGKIYCEFTGHSQEIRDAAFSPSDSIMLTCSKDQRIVLWDLSNSATRVSFSEHEGAVNDVCFLNNYRNFISASDDNTLRYWGINSKTSKKVFTGHSGSVNTLAINHSNTKILSASDDGTAKLWDVESGKEIVSFISIAPEDFLTVTPDHYFFASKNAAKEVGYTIGLTHYPFEQFDLQYNRPDLVLKRLGNTDTLLIRLYHEAYLKRLKKLNFSESMFSDSFHLPVVHISGKDSLKTNVEFPDYSFQITASDTKFKLDRLNVYVNDVPIYGLKGIPLKAMDISSFTKTIVLTLAMGENKIQVSCLNQRGAESYKETHYVTCTPKETPKETLYFIGIGIDKYYDAARNLRYSAKDIRDLAANLKRQYGDNIVIDTLIDEHVTRDAIKKLKQKLLQSMVNDKVIIAFSGHGLLNKDYDYYLSAYNVNFDKPEEGGIPYEEVEWLLDSIPARKKLMLIDACHSGEVDKEELLAINAFIDSTKRGMSVAYSYKPTLGMKNSFEFMQQVFANVNRGTGATVIAASGGTQFAQENGDLKNGVFTYSIVELMQQEKEVTVQKLKSAVGKRVEELTNGLQKPTSRNETIGNDWIVW